MKVYIVLVLAVLSVLPLQAAEPADPNKMKQAVMTPIEALFDAMRAHDSAKILAQFTPNANLQRAGTDHLVSSTDITKFATSIGKSKKYLDEKLLSTTISYSGNLASIWTPFVFYIDGKLSHCGVNSFQLIKTPKGWKIHNLIDNSFQGDCRQFIKQYQ